MTFGPVHHECDNPAKLPDSAFDADTAVADLGEGDEHLPANCLGIAPCGRPDTR